MLEKLKQEAMRQGMKLLSNPKVMKMMADPRLMNAISQGFAIKGRMYLSFDQAGRADRVTSDASSAASVPPDLSTRPSHTTSSTLRGLAAAA